MCRINIGRVAVLGMVEAWDGERGKIKGRESVWRGCDVVCEVPR